MHITDRINSCFSTLNIDQPRPIITITKKKNYNCFSNNSHYQSIQKLTGPCLVVQNVKANKSKYILFFQLCMLQLVSFQFRFV